MKYISTRGGMAPLTFSEAVMAGLATDGGLLLPADIPAFSPAELEELATRPYAAQALEIFSRFVGDDIPAPDLRHLVDKSYAAFSHPAVVPLKKTGSIHIQELFHGPTLAFKDVALQFLGNLFEYLLAQRGDFLNVVGATSGDTGSAAIHGLRGKDRINIFILYPRGKVSPVQEMQMTSVLDDNVFNLAINGNFDDGQRIVKELFAALDFKEKYHLGAVNSINWARVMAQTVYYFNAWSQLPPAARRDFVVVVPTGNFGNIFAGWIAGQMGLPIKRLVLATNANDILYRFIAGGDYRVETVQPTFSPSMDIQRASNFERYLYYLLDKDSARLRILMQEFGASGVLAVDKETHRRLARDFASYRVDNQATIATIRACYQEHHYLIDPHTAAGVAAARAYEADYGPVKGLVCLATAHPAKFPEAVSQAIDQAPAEPPAIAALQGRPCRFQEIAATTAAVRAYIEEKLMESGGMN
ncbi:MAG: threonine synthase [Deltaproteobacteria bacterium]|nr:threonine synthase [Deltaproteobacteria bacterium]